jgi:hypothetical protein
MGDDRLLREEIRLPLDSARTRIRRHTGLYPDENLTRDVLLICDEVIGWLSVTPDVQEARESVEARCLRLSQVTDRFAERDLGTIAKARSQAIAAIDRLQDVVFAQRRMEAMPQGCGILLRQRSR